MRANLNRRPLVLVLAVRPGRLRQRTLGRFHPLGEPELGAASLL